MNVACVSIYIDNTEMTPDDSIHLYMGGVLLDKYFRTYPSKNITDTVVDITPSYLHKPLKKNIVEHINFKINDKLKGNSNKAFFVKTYYKTHNPKILFDDTMMELRGKNIAV